MKDICSDQQIVEKTAHGLEFLTGGLELLLGKCTVFLVPVHGILLTGGT